MRELLTATLEHELSDTDNRVWGWPERPAARIDLHCHSTFSRERLHLLPGMHWHPLLTPEQTYDRAKARGMTFVTLTDHDTIDGCRALLDARGERPDFIFGEEVSVRFPEDRTLIHINVYDIDEAEHDEIRRRRDNIYELVAYLRAHGKLYVLNHMTWTGQQRVLKPEQIEAMLELFDVFEGLNGARSYPHNALAWQATAGRGKVLVGGSDSHTFRVGTTYTRTQGATRREVLDSIRAGRAVPCGAFGTPEKLREDVWLSLQTNVERGLAEATGRWQRFGYQTVRRIGKMLHPLACLGYHRYQDVVIRGFLRALPA
jgi:predicted metal-dependent phosphoesterase TrpH